MIDLPCTKEVREFSPRRTDEKTTLKHKYIGLERASCLDYFPLLRENVSKDYFIFDKAYSLSR